MIEFIISKLTNGQFMLGLLIAIAFGATIFTLVLPLFETDPLTHRMKSVGSERDRLRQREHDRLSKNSKQSLRPEPKAFVKQIVEKFNLSNWLGTVTSKRLLSQAGFRGAAAETTFLFSRLISPILFLCLGIFLIVFTFPTYSLTIKTGIAVLSLYIGIKFPEIFLNNIISKRQKSIRIAFPDALDLLLICVESGMSIEHAFQKVGNEISNQSVPLAEELALMTAELSFLPDRRMAYDNLGNRVGIESVKSVCIVLLQAEKYGTPLGSALRTVSAESREMRMMAAEKKAASLPPKLTVPLIVFFLPVLFVVIGGPAAIQVSRMMH